MTQQQITALEAFSLEQLEILSEALESMCGGEVQDLVQGIESALDKARDSRRTSRVSV